MSNANETAGSDSVKVNLRTFFNLNNMTRIRPDATIHLSDHSYLPKVDDPRSDWIASIAVPAFFALETKGIEAQDFCFLGTGAGLDALAAIEILKARNVIITDLHEDVIFMAQQNIINHVIDPDNLTVSTAFGDLLSPLLGNQIELDLLYENIPKIHISDAGDISAGQASSTFIKARLEKVPDFVRNNLIELHYIALKQAYPLLRAGGRALSSIGGRVPVEAIVRLGSELGYSTEILIFTWKRQSEPEDVIGGYARWEKQGYGPFRFYPLSVLAETFGSTGNVTSDGKALEIEQALGPYEMSATEALLALSSRVPIGHTVVVLESVK